MAIGDHAADLQCGAARCGAMNGTLLVAGGESIAARGCSIFLECLCVGVPILDIWHTAVDIVRGFTSATHSERGNECATRERHEIRPPDVASMAVLCHERVGVGCQCNG